MAICRHTLPGLVSRLNLGRTTLSKRRLKERSALSNYAKYNLLVFMVGGFYVLWNQVEEIISRWLHFLSTLVS